MFQGNQTSPKDEEKPTSSKNIQSEGMDVEEKPKTSISTERPVRTSGGGSLAWVDKYKPAAISQLIGQNGAKSPMNKLCHWLKNWGKWHLGGATGKKGKK